MTNIRYGPEDQLFKQIWAAPLKKKTPFIDSVIEVESNKKNLAKGWRSSWMERELMATLFQEVGYASLMFIRLVLTVSSL